MREQNYCRPHKVSVYKSPVECLKNSKTILSCICLNIFIDLLLSNDYSNQVLADLTRTSVLFKLLNVSAD